MELRAIGSFPKGKGREIFLLRDSYAGTRSLDKIYSPISPVKANSVWIYCGEGGGNSKKKTLHFRINLHDVPKNWFTSDRNHRLRAKLSFFTQARSQAASQQNNFHDWILVDLVDTSRIPRNLQSEWARAVQN